MLMRTAHIRFKLSSSTALRALMLGCVLLSAQTAAAAQLNIQATGTETGNYSSNALMSSVQSTSLIGSTTTPELAISETTATSSISSDTKVSENVFDKASFNSTDVHEAANLTEHNQRWSIGTGLHADYDTTRTSEVTNFGLNNVSTRHLGLSVTPEITFTPSAVDSFSLAGSANRSTYDNANFVDYNTYSITPSYTHRFDPQNAGSFSIQAQRYDSIHAASRSIDSIGPSIGWQTDLSQRLTVHAGIGAETTREYDLGTAPGPWTWQYTFSGGLSFKGLQDIVKMDATREQFPYGNGTQALQTKFEFSETHALNSLISVNIGGTYLTATYQTATTNNLDSLSMASAGLTYHATQTLDINANYQYRHETLTNTSATANDNAVTLTLTYRPQAWTL